MESKKHIYHLWVQYTTKNEEHFFRQFVTGFVSIWKSQLDLDWSRLPDWLAVKHDSGPLLSRLPEELLPAIGKFMYLAKEETEKKSLNSKSLKEVELLVQCLIIICRNFDNIPFIASCNYVSETVGIAATIIHQLVEHNAEFGDAGPSFFIYFCHFLECLYDPYFTWRHFLAGNPVDFENLPFQPALLHVEVVPFIYDCFQTPLVEQYPQLSTELVNILGAIISGAQHNALRAICPATVNIVMGIISHSKANTDVRCTAIQCFVMMIQVLNKSSPDQRQIEVGTIIQLYQDLLIELVMNEWHEKSSQTLCEMVIALRSLLTDSWTREQIQGVMVDNHVLDTVITIIEESARFSFERQILASECVKALTSVLVGSADGKEKLVRTSGYERLFAALRSIGPPSKGLLHALLTMAAEEEPSEQSKLKNADVLLLIVRWLGSVDADDQQWLAGVAYKLCTSNLPSKTLACRQGIILAICQALEDHAELSQKTANELIKLLEVLASHSITSYELKQIFLLLREDADLKFPYRIQLLHAISSVARKSDFVDCNNYFDIQRDSDGISVPGIKKWPGAGYGFSFHCWVQLDPIKEPQSLSPTNYRRQLFSLLTSGGTGLEAFFRPDGALVVGISTKKEFLSASVTDFPLVEGQWHCVDICHMAARRPFGQRQLMVYIDGAQRMAASVKSPAMTDPFAFCTIGSVVQRHSNNSGAIVDGKSGDRGGLLSGGVMDRGLLPTLINQVPNYFTLPLRSSTPLDPNVKSFPAGMQDTIWGSPTSLRGQVGLACLFQEALTPQQVKTLYDGGPNCFALFAPEDVPEFIELTNKLVFCFSPAAYWNNLCLDLTPANMYEGHVVAAHCQTYSIKNAINGIGGVHALFPILENASTSDEGPDLSFLSPSVEKEYRLIEGHEGSVDSDEWEILPSSSYSDWKLEQNPISGFLSLLKNIIAGSPVNQEQLLKNNGLLIIGVLLTKAKPHLIDVNVLMAVQLLVEMARDIPNPALRQSLFQHILFNFRIWSRSQFHIRIGHVQYISTVIKDDRRYFRKKYGVQFLLDVIRQYHSASEVLSSDDSKTISMSLLGLVKYYIQKEPNFKEVAAILGFLSSVKEEILLREVLEMLISYLESRSCRDQVFLLLCEPHGAETLYCLLVEKSFSMELKQKVLKLLSVLLRSDCVYERDKSRLRLQDASVLGGKSVGMYPGLIALLQDQQFSMEVTAMLLDQILSADSSGAYAGALSLLHALSLADLDLKLEAARKILTATFMKANAPQHFARQVGWQDCITRLLVKRPISTPKPQQSGSFPDLMSFDEENLELENASYSPSSVSRISTHVTDAALVLENEIKEVADTVTSAVADNIHYAADNITSVVASAYSVFRQKTFEMQESLEELGESAVSRLKKRRSLISLYDSASDRECSPSPSRASPRPVRTPQLLASLGLDLDALSLGNRSGSSSSTEDLSSPNQNDNTASTKDDISIASAQSISNASINEDEEERLMSVALKQWKEMDAEKLVDQEEELCYLVANILFTVLWRGVEGASKEAWKERGQVMACVNFLGLNNELYCSHLQLKLRILEMGVQASLSDLRDVGQTMALSVHAENAAQLMRWIYDLVVLDPNEDTSKKTSTKLLDGVLGLLDALLVFQEGPGEEWMEMAKMAFGILLSCSANSNLELCAMATAKLHTLIQTRNMREPEEGAYLLYFMNRIVQKTIKVDNQEHYSFLIPVVKALLEKLNVTLGLANHLPGLPQTQAGPAFFDDFQCYCQEAQWQMFMEKKVKPLHDAYQAALNAQLTEAMNVFWAECYESSKTAVHRRNREVGESKLRFQTQMMEPFRQRQTEDGARYNSLLNQQRNQELLVRRKWRHLKQFFIGPRGAWRSRSPVSRHWKLSHHENFSRMRLKLCPSLTFDPHTDASNLRDNTGCAGHMQSVEEIPLSLSISSAAVCGETEEDSLPEEELRMVSEAEHEGPEAPGKEKLIIQQECELVTLMTVVRGRLELTTSYFYFYDLSPVKEDVERQDFKWALSRLREVHLRRYNLRRSALEFFLTDQTNYFLNFSTKTRNKVFTRILSLRPPNLCHYSSRTPADLLRSTGLTHKWVSREISNFDYLTQLNTLAGRTYNDLSQYPVFPWIVADYTSEELDLTNPSTFRDLSKPIGVVNPKNVPEVQAKYDSYEDPSGKTAKFHYGTHYSNSAGVLHYLVRVEPFTSLHIELQSGRFDVADRQFHSIPQTWKLLMDNPNDVKELTPEFFYFPEFLKNMNGFDLGLLQGTKERVNDVILPKWASSPEDFIYKHRKALECEYVSQHLHEWIDLIFGYKQKGPKAVEALNVFYYCSYEGAVDLDAISNPVEREALEGMINNFGQTPSQLLKEPHPQRLSLEDAITKMLKSELRRTDFTLFLDNLRPIPIEVSNEKDPIVFVSSPRSPPRSFLQVGLADTLLSVSKLGVVGTHSWHPHDRHGPRGFTLDVDPTINNAKTRKKLSGPFHPSLPLSSHLFVVSNDAKFLFSGGYWDSSLRVYSLAKSKTVASVRRHFDLVTCVALDQCGSFLITGSRDTTCVVWDVSHLGMGSSSTIHMTPRPVQTLYGHDKAVTCVGIMTELDMAVSGSLDGTVNVHTIQEGQYMRTLEPVGCEGLKTEITFLTLSSQGHVVFSATDKMSHSVHVFSVNGVSLGSKYVSGRVTGLAVAGDYLVVVDDAGDLTMSRILGLRPVYDIPLHVPIQSVVVTAGNTHLLVPTREGNIIVLGVLSSMDAK